MGFLTMVKRCHRCWKKYIFNPDGGKGLKCPYCGHVPLNPMKPGRPMRLGEKVEK